MRIIFLDFDGVLNCTGSFMYHARRDKLCGVLVAAPNPISVMLIDSLLEEDASINIVVSSSWRRASKTMGDLKHVLFTEFGLCRDSRVIDRTTCKYNKSWNRGDEISEWLSEWKGEEITHYVILDDGSDFNEDQKENLVLTKIDYGFQYPEYEKARIILGLRNKYGLYIP